MARKNQSEHNSGQQVLKRISGKNNMNSTNTNNMNHLGMTNSNMANMTNLSMLYSV